MYLGDANQLEVHLNNDWTVLLKNLKLREDFHFELLQYNNHILSQLRNHHDDTFINDEILQHHQQIAKIAQAISTFTSEEKEIREKYQSSIVSYEEISKLMSRVGARVIETYQYSFDKCKTLNGELLDKHLKMKSSLIKMLNQKDRLNLEEIINSVLDYSHNKLVGQWENLKKIVQSLQNGDYEKTSEGYQSPGKKPQAQVISVQKKKASLSIQKAKVLSNGREERSPVWQELKAQEKLRKQKQKVAIRLMHGLYSTMDLSRQQIIEDMCKNQKEKSKRLYTDIFNRNKYNHGQILKFQSKKEEFQEKVKIFKQKMQKERQASDSRRTSGKRDRKKQELADSLNFSKLDQQDQHGGRKSGSNRYRIQSPKTKQKVLNNQYPILVQQDFNFIKYNQINQSAVIRPKDKLPLLQASSDPLSRATSFQQRIESTKQRFLKQQKPRYQPMNEEQLQRGQKMKERSVREQKMANQRAKVPLKNIDVSVDGVMRLDQSSMNKQQRNKIPNPLQYTFYVRRNNRFYEPNHNIIF